MQVTALILYDEKHRILLQHRTDDAPTFPGRWGFFGGEIERRETPEEAMKRETLEELAYELRRPRLWTIRRFTHQGLNYTQYVFLEAYDGSELILGEGQGMGWFLPSETKDLAMISHAREVVEALGQHCTIDYDDGRR